ncbi:MAG: fibronectin type III domain-containing protein, partial [Gammaproteobacteria bacterium]
ACNPGGQMIPRARPVMRRLGAAFACIAMLGALPAHAQPAAPANPMLAAAAGAASSSSLVFSWDEVTHAAGILGYIVHLQEVGFQFNMSFGNSLPFGAGISGIGTTRRAVIGDIVDEGASLTFTNLQPATTFKARIRAVSAASGNQLGAWSAIAEGATTDGPPGPPSYPAPAEVGHKSVILRWDAPDKDGGAPITGYRVRWNVTRAVFLNRGGADGEDIPGGASVRTHTVTGLTNDQAYIFAVAAVNRHGAGSWKGILDTPRKATGVVCLGNVAIPQHDACLAAAEAGYILSKNLPGEQEIVVTAARSTNASLPAATVTLRATDGDNAIQADTDIEGSLPALDGATLNLAAGAGAASATFSLTPKAGGDGGELRIAFTLGGADSDASIALLGTVFTLIDAGIRITEAAADRTCPAAHNAAVTAFMLEEGGDAAGVCVSLASNPGASAPVSCTVTNTDLIEVTPAELAFSSANWQTAQPVMVRAPDNDLAVAADSTDTLVCASSAASGEYADASVNASITISDTDMVAATGTLTANTGVNENGGVQPVIFTATLDAGALPSEECRVGFFWRDSVADAGEVVAVVGRDVRLFSLFGISILPGESSGSVTYQIDPIPDDDADTELIKFINEPQGCSGTASVDFGGVTVAITDFDSDFDFGMLDGAAGAHAADGLLVARYLAGARGADLGAGLGLTDEAVAAAAAVIARNMPLLDVDGVNGTTMADGIMIARYFLGVTSGAGLTDGQADSTQEQTVTGNIMKNLQ